MRPEFKSEFNIDPKLIYLNSGTHSICPTRVTDAVVRRLRAYEQNPTGGLMGVWGELWSMQKGLAEFLGARPEDLILRANVTVAMNAFVLGMPLGGLPFDRPGGEILISDSEYGAMVNLCRYRAERDGLGLRTFHLPTGPRELEGMRDERLAQIVIQALKPETRLLMLSHVITGNGLKLPIELIARETRKRGVLFAVDGAHATGAIEMDFARLEDVDFYGGNLHKWMMGPKGTGFGWVHPKHQGQLRPEQIGWTSYEVAPPHAEYAPGHAFTQRHLLAASIDFAPWLALEETLEFWREHGADRIRARIRELQLCVEREMRAHLPWAQHTPTDPTLRGPLLSYELPPEIEAIGYPFMTTLLARHGLQIAMSRLQDKWVLRISPHVHNTEEQIVRAVKLLKTEVGGSRG